MSFSSFRFTQNEDGVQQQQSQLNNNNKDDIIIEQGKTLSQNNQIYYSISSGEQFHFVCTAKHTKQAQAPKNTFEDESDGYFYLLDYAVHSKEISISSRPSFQLPCTQDQCKYQNQPDFGADLQTVDQIAYTKDPCRKGVIVLLVLLLIATVTQSILAWYGAYDNKCKKGAESATLAPLFMFGISIAEMVFSSIIVVITLVETQRCQKKRYELVLVKLVKTCLIVLFVLYIFLFGYIEVFSGEYDGCEFKKVVLKIQALLTLVQCTLFIVLGHQ